MWPLALAIVGFVFAAVSLNTGARYFAMILMVGGGHGANAFVLAWAQKTVWSYIHADTAKPRYVLAMSVNSASALGCILLSLFLRKVVQHVNRNIESGTNVAPVMKGEVSRLRDCLKS
ncbi:major facilitator superfamily transporter [Botryosphaeria dothidea]|uniref:Major facilitator superfamily transporter n=1 Tax=Botryosphaeria dothidea TaxID=55169 RepID=A0A8H4IQR0_9PEZI|nr:major facilitator superfamily transporter [Botryosphaeria dothidea]